MRIVAVAGLHDPCTYCQVILNHFNSYDRGLKELRACGVEVSFGKAPLATHYCYPHTGAMQGNADAICDGHACMLRGIDEFGSLDAFIESLKERHNIERVLAEMEQAIAVEMAGIPENERPTR